ncbi:hypothetical protein QFZ47_002369 [Variovorax paradoxus]|nr:hypothetical protein [Variovorax paradoxus]
MKPESLRDQWRGLRRRRRTVIRGGPKILEQTR